MDNYKITIEVERRDDSKYPSHYDTVYEQTIEGDESLVNGVVRTVLLYNSGESIEPSKISE